MLPHSVEFHGFALALRLPSSIPTPAERASRRMRMQPLASRGPTPRGPTAMRPAALARALLPPSSSMPGASLLQLSSSSSGLAMSRAAHGSPAHATAAMGAAGPAAVWLTLERAVGGSTGSDKALAATGVFAAEVFPDLPIASTWGSLFKAANRQADGKGVWTPVAILSGARSTLTQPDPPALMLVLSLLFKRSSQELPSAAEVATEGVMKVSTVAVNVSLQNSSLPHRV